MLASFCSQLTKEQIEILEAEFSINSRPDITTRDRLAQTLKLSNLLIHVWFQTRRIRLCQPPTPVAVYHALAADINDHPAHHPISNKTSGKRKLPCDVTDYGWTYHISKKSSTILTPIPVDRPSCLPMASSSYHSSGCGAMRSEASRDTSSGATSSFMSVDFLSRSSGTSPVCTPNYSMGHFPNTPVFYPPAELPPFAYSFVH